MNEDEYKKFEEGMALFNEQTKQKLTLMRPVVNQIINNKITDTKSIEKTLDTLLGFVFIGLGKLEFHRLNNFYSTIHPKNAKDYKKIYKEMCEEDY
jgi:hypothetical protein